MEKVMTMNKKKTHKFPVYVVKRMGLAKWKYWLIRTIGYTGFFIIDYFLSSITTLRKGSLPSLSVVILLSFCNAVWI